jgi:hypothetical protein
MGSALIYPASLIHSKKFSPKRDFWSALECPLMIGRWNFSKRIGGRGIFDK